MAEGDLLRNEDPELVWHERVAEILNQRIENGDFLVWLTVETYTLGTEPKQDELEQLAAAVGSWLGDLDPDAVSNTTDPPAFRHRLSGGLMVECGAIVRRDSGRGWPVPIVANRVPAIAGYWGRR